MKKTLVSLAAVAALTTGAMAADKGIDFVTTGEATIYYETTDNGNVANSDDTLFGKTESKANFAFQINNDADLGNGFALGSQLTFLGTSGLTTSSVSNVAQNNTSGDEVTLTKINLTKKVGNTTVKLGRQELPKSLSPFAFSEKWNVYKNTFDAVLVVNSDIPGVTLVGAIVGTTNSSKDVGAWTDLVVKTQGGVTTTAEGAYMLTAQTAAIPMTTLTASYYQLGQVITNPLGIDDERATALWVDAKLAGKSMPLGLKIGLQGGSITPDGTGLDATNAMGVKLGLAPTDGLNLCFAYSTVDDGSVQIRNAGTGVKTPLYTQLVKNQDYISKDNDTLMVRAAYKLGGTSKIILQASSTTDNSAAENDATDIELVYKVKAGGVNMLAGLFNTKMSNDDSAKNYVRLVARYAF